MRSDLPERLLWTLLVFILALFVLAGLIWLVPFLPHVRRLW